MNKDDDDVFKIVPELKQKIEELYLKVKTNEKAYREEISTLNEKLDSIEERTGETERLAIELSDIIENQKKQMIELKLSISELKSTINDVNKATLAMQKGKEEFFTQFQEMKTAMEVMNVTLEQFNQLPDKLENISLELNSQKVITGMVRKVAWLFATAFLIVGATAMSDIVFEKFTKIISGGS